jgi:hypothetical protein
MATPSPTEPLTNPKKKTEYFQHQFDLSQNQIKKIVKAIQNKNPIFLRLTKESFHNGTIALPLTKKESKNVIDNKGFDYSLNKTKIKMFKLEDGVKEGGILPLLVPILAGIGAVSGLVGTATGIAKTVIDSNKRDRELEEQQRTNKEMEKIARGEGCKSENIIESNGMFLNPPTSNQWKGYGMNLDVKEFVSGSGLDDIGKRSLRNILKNLSTHFKIEKQGNGLFLSYPH